MKYHTHLRGHPATRLLAIVATGLAAEACFVEDIEAIIAAHGVTEDTSSGGASEASGSASDTSTGTSTSTSTGSTGTDDASASSAGSESTAADMGVAGSSSSSGPSGPVCGDGVVEGDELCDDGNETPGDGCQDCVGDSIVFVSSAVYKGYALKGLAGADQYCRSLAGKAGLERPLTYKAWLSTATVSAGSRMVHSRGRYVLVNGLVVAQDWDALTSGTLEHPIMVDEHSETRDDRAWTGTLASGEPALGSEFCEDWDDDSGLLKLGGTGYSIQTDAWWSFLDHAPCDSNLRLYCVEQLAGSEP